MQTTSHTADTTLFNQHREMLDNAIKALHERTFYAHYPELPSPKVYGETADATGRERFEALLGKDYIELKQYKPSRWGGEEESPYTQQSLDIRYPLFDAEILISTSKSAFEHWRKTTPEERAGILLESLERTKGRFFEIAHATMHTTGQGYMMAFQASGPHAADRALEAVASGYEELKRFPDSALWNKPMGKFNIQLNKTWKAIPKGISLVIGCSTFPTWNTVPGMYASLITGNTVIVKPHPKAILPIAIVVADLQAVLVEHGFEAGVCQLAADTTEQLIAKELAEHPEVKLIDYTGSSTFGNYLESLQGKNVFTEKAGVNPVILDSVQSLDAVLSNLAFSVCLYSGQMCTAPQNFFIPGGGINTPEGIVPFDEVAQRFAAAIRAIVENPKAGPFVLGAVQNGLTCKRVEDGILLGDEVVLKPEALHNPMFPQARTFTPALITVDAAKKEIFSKELFGPLAILIRTTNTDESIALAKEIAQQYGAISCAAYTTDESTKEKIMDEMGLAATPVSFNLTGGIYVNQHATFSDFHVTGGNPAGNASFTNPEYVIKRFTWVGFREPVMAAV
jgi:phenylacetic acid degradation protein paaN